MMLRDRSQLGAVVGLCTLMLSWPAARGQSDPIPYQLLPVAGLGTRFASPGAVADPVPEPGDRMVIDGLNDQGQLLFSEFGSQPALVVYSGGHFTPVALPLGDALGGFWPADLLLTDGSINQQGEVAFSAAAGRAGEWLGTFVWDPQTQQSTPVALPGFTPTGMLRLSVGGPYQSYHDGPYQSYHGELGSPYIRPLINNHGEVAFMAPLIDVAGKNAGAGLFFWDRDGKLMPIVLPGDTLPVVGAVYGVNAFSLNDSGVVAFAAGGYGTGSPAFIWEKGKITPVGPAETEPRGVAGVWVNDVNGNVLLEGNGDGALYLAKGDQLTPVAVQGQPMPGGGVYLFRLWDEFYSPVSAPNAAGQSLFLTGIRGGHGSAAAYRVDADGQLTLIAQDGDTTAGGETITLNDIYNVNSVFGVALNGKGQLALPVAINADPTRPGLTPAVMALLTPTGP